MKSRMTKKEIIYFAEKMITAQFHEQILKINLVCKLRLIFLNKFLTLKLYIFSSYGKWQ